MAKCLPLLSIECRLTGMKILRVLAVTVALLIAAPLTACATTPVIAPETMDVNELQGATVELLVGQVLNMTTGSLAVDSYTAKIADSSIAEFVQGNDDGSAVFNPGITALKVGETSVTMTNAQGGIQPLEFTVKVSK